MFDINYIVKLLKNSLEKTDKFIIYPYGVNGVNVKNVLKNYFDMEPCFIVDNEYSQYNSKIINKKILRDVYQKDMYVILTAENDIVNAQILGELLEFVSAANIINLRNENSENRNENKNVKYDGEGFLLKDFLPSKMGECRKVPEKVKVRIVHRSSTTWNALRTICQAFKEDSLFDVLLIIHSDWTYKESIKQAEQDGYRYVMWDEYSGKADQPDILILNGSLKHGEVIDGLLECREYARLVIVASWTVIRYMDSVEDEWQYRMVDEIGIYRPDYYLFDSLQYDEIKKSRVYSEKVIEMGNAKFDEIYQAIQKKQYDGEWKKLEGRKTVLWTTSHGVTDKYYVGKGVTFDLYAKTIFDYALHNPDMGFIFRPSVGLIVEMLRLGFWSKSDLQLVKEYCSNSSNVIFDDTDTYGKAFSLADGVITDAFCGIICSALPTMKPICVAYRSRNDISWYPELTDNYYSAYESQDIVNFLDLVKNGEDPMFALRKQAGEKCVKHFDGKNGWRIKEFIKEKYLEKET